MSSTNERREQWTIQVNSETSNNSLQKWVSEVTHELNNLSQTRSMESNQWKVESIYRIPWSLKKLHRTAYQPQTVSIGPYHRDEPRLWAMEKHKQRALLNFLERSKKPLQFYVDELMPIVKDLQNAYDQLPPKWTDDREAFLKLMIVDGCFVLEAMRTATAKRETWGEKGYAYEANDPVFSEHGKLYFYPHLKRDMLMLENQLPLLLLIKLVATEASSTQYELIKLILKFLDRWESRDRACSMERFYKCLHILDLYRKSLLLVCRPKPKPKCWQRIWAGLPVRRSKKKEDNYIGSATELMESGIRFEPSKTRNLNDISFACGVLKLPKIVVDDASESEYLNMMALERFHVDASNEVTSYVFFMDRIIDGAADVGLLRWRGILRNSLGSDKAVARLLNSLSTDACLNEGSSLGNVHREVAKYCRSPLPRWMAFAKHNYFTNPWVGLSIVAAIFLFALTGVQTTYTVLGYYQNDEPKP